ncbi:serine hydrolase [Lusitaniella coriacea]|uniref:serine hydrolase n=1 Tax=Lusitaniella coriacea TaxID=1983105 RepID=UPI003CFB5575
MVQQFRKALLRLHQSSNKVSSESKLHRSGRLAREESIRERSRAKEKNPSSRTLRDRRRRRPKPPITPTPQRSVRQNLPSSSSVSRLSRLRQTKQQARKNSRRRELSSLQGMPSTPQLLRSTTPSTASETVSRRSSFVMPTTLRYILRLLILGIGLGAIAGTFLAALDPTRKILPAEANQSQQVEKKKKTAKSSALPMKAESSELNAKVREIVAQYPQFQPSFLFVDLDTGEYVKLGDTTAVAAASTIKVPILIAFFQDVDAGKIALDEMLTMQEESMAGESGTMQYKAVGTKFSALETATKMITISDNTATNMIIDRLGGAEALNQRFQEWGLQSTTIQNPLPDVEGTNTTSPADLANLMAMVNTGSLVSLRSRDRLLEIMRNVVTNDLLPQGLENGATIAHKTGNIGEMIADAGIIDTPTGKRYIAVVMVERPHNDRQGRELIRSLSRTVYQYFTAPPKLPNVTTTPATASDSVATEN